MRGSSSTNPLIPLGLVSAGLVSIIAGSFASAPDKPLLMIRELLMIGERPKLVCGPCHGDRLGR